IVLIGLGVVLYAFQRKRAEPAA
ncbi:MAG: hypothetical protein QOJ26_1442, partial [Thermoplasmata archaeon]|nr:hypothetical protein [Thermoplasmata archaeon]